MNTAGFKHNREPSIVLHSALAPTAAADALSRSIDGERRTIFSMPGYKGSRPVLGEVFENAFRLQRRRYWRNDFAPHFYGRFQAEPGGTRIDGYFDVSRWVRTFMRLWLGGVVLLGGPIFVLTFLDVTTHSHFTSGDTWVGVSVFPAMLIFGIFLPRLGRLLSRRHEQLILEHVRYTLAARDEEPGPVSSKLS